MKNIKFVISFSIIVFLFLNQKTIAYEISDTELLITLNTYTMGESFPIIYSSEYIQKNIKLNKLNYLKSRNIGEKILDTIFNSELEKRILNKKTFFEIFTLMNKISNEVSQKNGYGNFILFEAIQGYLTKVLLELIIEENIDVDSIRLLYDKIKIPTFNENYFWFKVLETEYGEKIFDYSKVEKNINKVNLKYLLDTIESNQAVDFFKKQNDFPGATSIRGFWKERNIYESIVSSIRIEFYLKYAFKILFFYKQNNKYITDNFDEFKDKIKNIISDNKEYSIIREKTMLRAWPEYIWNLKESMKKKDDVYKSMP